jgi:hypothetical protein
MTDSVRTRYDLAELRDVLLDLPEATFCCLERAFCAISLHWRSRADDIPASIWRLRTESALAATRVLPHYVGLPVH